MPFKDRLNGRAFTCANRRYVTNTKRGKSHGPRRARGSVFDRPLLEGGGYTLWLEHIEEKRTGDEWYWLMWYDKNGNPTIPASGVFDDDGIKEIARQLASFIRI